MAFRGRGGVAETLDVTGMGLAEAMHEMSPDLLRTSHLEELIQVFEALARGERRLVIVTVPPRMGKSATICHGLAWLLSKKPALKTVYATYSQKLSDQQSRSVRYLVERNGFVFSKDHNRIDDWRSPEGGGMISTGVEGPFTGFGVDLGILDDPVKDRNDAESPTVRESTWNWITDVLFRGIESAASVIVVQTRWHVDDPSGRLLRGMSDRFKKWQHIHLRPIITDENGVEHSIWPERWPLEELQAIRGNGTSRTWTSLYEGDPVAQGSTLFGDPAFGEMPGELRAVG